MANPSILTKAHPLAPLRERTFRRIWTTSVLANLGQLVLGVGAAWEMTRLSDSSEMVALVQTAMMLPLMIASLPAGALADSHDRRRLAMGGLGISMCAASLLTLIALFGHASPWVLLAFCSLIGIGVAVYSPAWSASINEQVSPANLPAAVALGTISYNVARSFGPALGGAIVLALGASAAFAINALLYIPLLIAFFLWRRESAPARLPPEGVARAILSGTRYVMHSPLLVRALLRAFLFGTLGATATALAPLIARDTLQGTAALYGILLGASGAGAVTGALFVSKLRERFGSDLSTRALMVVTAGGLVVTGTSTSVPLTCLALFVIGGANILVIALLNVVVQLSVPRWVLGRSLSLFSSCLTGGIALGAWVWGRLADISSVETAMIASGGIMLLLAIASRLLPLNEGAPGENAPVVMGNEPEHGLALTLRSGPVVIEIDYRVQPEQARAFYRAAMKLRASRLRNGGFAWSIARDIADPAVWTERYECPTWGDYLRVRDRQTTVDRDAQMEVTPFLVEGAPPQVRRQLLRPFGSVRWDAATPDPKADIAGLTVP